MAHDPFPSKKDTVTYETGSVKSTNYTIKATTLEEVHAQIQKKGPVTNGDRFAGATDAIPADFDEHVEFHVEEVDGVFKATARFDKSKLKCNFVMILPEFPEYKQLSDDEQGTWLNFYYDVIKHEYEHVADYEAELGKWTEEMAAMRGEGKDKKEKKAKQEAHLALNKLYKSKFDKANVEKRLSDTAKKLDAASGHGPVLRFTISVP